MSDAAETNESNTPFWHLPQGDPCRVLLTKSYIPAWRRAEIDRDPQSFAWDPNDRDEDAFLLDWLNANAEGWATEIEIIEDGGYADAPSEDISATQYHTVLRFPSSEQADAYRAWRDARLKSWNDRHALVAKGASYCHDCGGPVVTARQTSEVQVRGILLRHTHDGPWCEHCQSAEGTAWRMGTDDPSERFFELNGVARRLFGIPKGHRGCERGEAVIAVIDTDETTTDEELERRIA